MLDWLGRSRRLERGWLALSLHPGAVDLAHGRIPDSGTPVISRCETRALDDAPEKILRELARYRCVALLCPGDYQLLMVEAPTVPAAELRSALRWRIKEMIDFPVDAVTIDVLDLPPEPGSLNHWMYAVAAGNGTIETCVRALESAKVPLEVIDVPETAQRNIAALYESPGRGLALLHIGEEGGLLTVNFKGELFLARRLEPGAAEIAAAAGDDRSALLNRILVELQRSFDHFERQFRFISVTQLLVGPGPVSAELAAHLNANLGMPVACIDLAEKLRFEPGGAPDPGAQARLFHVIGASLRPESTA